MAVGLSIVQPSTSIPASRARTTTFSQGHSGPQTVIAPFFPRDDSRGFPPGDRSDLLPWTPAATADAPITSRGRPERPSSRRNSALHSSLLVIMK